jgi:hypothetical protein
LIIVRHVIVCLCQVLKQCPSLVNAFDAQLSYQLVAFYGKDERYKVRYNLLRCCVNYQWIKFALCLRGIYVFILFV